MSNSGAWHQLETWLSGCRVDAHALCTTAAHMSRPRPLSASIVICTFNRARLLEATLRSLGRLRSTRAWDVVVVDNNSTDDTRVVVETAAHTGAWPIVYVFEPQQGKSHALNTGLAHARRDIVVFTDDDVEVEPEWLDEACSALDADASIEYTGGPVRPIWGAQPPDWIDRHRGDLWGTLAILDYGDESFIFEERARVPLGVNMAVRRSLIARIGGFHPELGRRGRSLLGQEQAEFFARARAAGARGRYVPRMVVHHHVPAARLTKTYFRRWWYWKGISRARVDAIHRRTELGLDLRDVPHIAAVPRYVWGSLPRSVVGGLRAHALGDRHAAMRHVMQAMFALGYIRGCWSHRPLQPVAAPDSVSRSSRSVVLAPDSHSAPR